MPGEPKRRHSRQRKGKRRASISFAIPNAVLCPNCNSMMIPHSVCRTCGFYRGKEVLNLSKTVKNKPKTGKRKLPLTPEKKKDKKLLRVFLKLIFKKNQKAWTHQK